MKTNRTWIGPALLVLLFAITFRAPSAAQSGNDRQDRDDRARHENCCLRTGTGQQGWTLASAPKGVTTPRTAVVLTPPNPSYAPALPGSAWVGPTAGSGVDNLPIGNYVYEFKFCLCRAEQGQHPVLSVLLFSDNETNSVTLNGGPNLISPTPSVSFAHPPGPFPVVFTGSVTPHANGAFRPCPEVNTVAITVDNEGGPTGLDAILSITGAVATDDGKCRCGDGDRD